MHFMPVIPFKGGQLAYQKTKGGNKTLILVHGFGEDSSVFDELITGLAENGLTVITLDFPGFGGSDSIHPVSIDLLADAIQAIILQDGLTEFVLIGHSLGGYTTLNFMRRNPNLPCKGFGLFHAHPFEDSVEKKKERRKTAAFIQQYGASRFAKSFVPRLFPPDFANKNGQLVEKLVEKASSFSNNALAAVTLAMRDRQGEQDTVSNTDLPVLFIIGMEDQLPPTDSILHQIALPKIAQVHLLNGVGHMGMYEKTSSCQQAIMEFVDFCYEF